ncbi:hypothetical protein ACLFLN_20355 [Acinetobacter pittii]
MVALSYFSDKFEILISKKDRINELTIKLFNEEGISALTGRASTKQDLINRIDYFKKIFEKVCTEDVSDALENNFNTKNRSYKKSDFYSSRNYRYFTIT